MTSSANSVDAKLESCLPGAPREASGPGASFSPPLQVRLLVMQPTPFCNLDCTYCYLPHRSDTRRMSLATVEAAVMNIVESGLLGDELVVIWHAGEPLVLPPEFYAEAFARIRTVVGTRATVRHSLQTNGTLVDTRWCDLFREWSVRVGVSLDGPADLHDRHRKTRAGQGSHRAVMRGVECLRAASLPFYAIAVVTASALDRADDILDFFEANEVLDLAFNIEELEGANARSSLDGDEDRVAGFFRCVFRRALASGGRLRVRELDRSRDALLRGLGAMTIGASEYVENEQVRPFEIITVDADGDYATFSPELLGQRHPRFDGFSLGNVHRDRMADALGTERFRSMFGEVMAGIDRCERHCRYYFLCGGGAPANKLFEHGRFDASETAFCRNAIQRPLDVCLELLESLASPTRASSAA